MSRHLSSSDFKSSSSSMSILDHVTSSQNKRRARKVSFLPTVLIRKTIHIDDYTDDEIASAWYNKTEMETIISDIKTTLLLTEEEGISAVNSDPQRCTRRGLESYTPEGQRLKERSRMGAKHAVFDEQEFQDETGILDPELLADLYYERTRFSEARARVMGRSDEEAVLRQGDKMQTVFPTHEVPEKKEISMSASFFGEDVAANRRATNYYSSGLRKVYSRVA